MRRKLNIPATAFAALVLCAGIFFVMRSGETLPHLQLRDGSEFRVFQIRYTAPGEPEGQYLGSSLARWWIYRHLPSAIRKRVPEPSRGIGDEFVPDHWVLSIWLAQINAGTHEPLLGEAGDVLMAVDSGQQTNLGWPYFADEYRKIMVVDPPTDSKRLTFEFPLEGNPVHFSIDNPAYRP